MHHCSLFYTSYIVAIKVMLQPFLLSGGAGTGFGYGTLGGTGGGGIGGGTVPFVPGGGQYSAAAKAAKYGEYSQHTDNYVFILSVSES